MLNSPLNFNDPTGQCAGVRGNPNSDNYDTTCWEFLENGDFCTIVECSIEGWEGWLAFFPTPLNENPEAGIFLASWTVTELTEVATRIQDTIDALASVGIDWKDTPLSTSVFSKGDQTGTSFQGKNLINLHSSHLFNGRTIFHEIGHAFALEYEFEELTNGGCFLGVCKRYAAEGYYFREYGRSATSDTYNAIEEWLQRPRETWSDAFSVFVFTAVNGYTPTNSDWSAVDPTLVTNMSDINDAAISVLKDHYEVP